MAAAACGRLLGYSSLMVVGHDAVAVAANYSQSNITQLPVYDRQTEIKLLYWF